MKTEVMTVTPEIAERWLKANTRNRRLRPYHVGNLAKALKRGEWELTHQGIAFDEDGVLCDGQHRLAAIVESGISAKILVIHGVNPQAFIAIDQGVNRSYSDLLGIDKRIAEPLRLAAKIHQSYGKESPQLVMQIAEAGLGPLLEYLVNACGTTRRFYSCSSMKLAAAIQIMAGQSRRFVTGQYTALVLCDFDQMTEASKAFVKQVTQGKLAKRAQNEIFARGLKVFDEGKTELTKIQVGQDDISAALAFAKEIIQHSLDGTSAKPAKRTLASALAFT